MCPFFQNLIDFGPEIVDQPQSIVVHVGPYDFESVPMVECGVAFSTRATRLSDCVSIVKANHTLVSRTVQRERILDTVRPFRGWLYALDIELHPKADFMNYVCVAVRGQKVFKTMIFRPDPLQ